MNISEAEAGESCVCVKWGGSLGLNSAFIVMQKLIEVSSSLCSVPFYNGLDINTRDDSNCAQCLESMSLSTAICNVWMGCFWFSLGQYKEIRVGH